MPRRTTLNAALLGFLVCAIWGSTVIGLAVDWWTQPEATQGVLILALAVWLAWTSRKAILAIPAVRRPRGLLVITAASLVFLGGKLASEFFLQRISLPILAAGAIWTFWGPGRLLAMKLPLALLAASIPLPGILYHEISTRLQLIASALSAGLIQFLGSDVIRDGNILRMDRLSIGVEEACNGLNALSALFVASLIMACAFFRRFPARAAIVLLSIPLAIAVNVVRITAVALIAQRHRGIATGFYHVFSGWLVFVTGFLALAMLAWVISRHGSRVFRETP